MESHFSTSTVGHRRLLEKKLQCGKQSQICFRFVTATQLMRYSNYKEKLLCSTILKVPVYDWLAHFRLEVQWQKHIMAEIIAEQNHAHHDLEGKEKGRAWVSISSFKHIFRSPNPLLLLPLVLTFWSVTLGPNLQHMGLCVGGDVQHPSYYSKWSSQAHSNIVLLSPCVLNAT